MATIDLQVGADADDAYEYDSFSTFVDGVEVYARDDDNVAGNRTWVGLRFTGSLPSNGDTIDVAYISVTRDTVASGDDMSHGIYFELANSPASFSAAGDIKNAPRTTSSVSWVGLNLGTGEVNSPSIVVPAQEWIDAQSPTAVAVLLRPLAQNDYLYDMQAHNDQPTLAAKLHIEYTPGGGAERRIFIVN